MQQQSFDLSIILSITTEILLCDFEEIYHILDFMEGYGHFTAELPEAGNRVKAHILAQHPALAEVKESDLVGVVTPDNYQQIIAGYKATYGDALTLTALATEGRSESAEAMHERIVGKDKLIFIDPNDPDALDTLNFD